MVPDAPPAGPVAKEAAPRDPGRDKDPVASLCAQVPVLSTGHRAALRRLFLTNSDEAVGVVTGMLVRAGVPDEDVGGPAAFKRWQLLAHVAAVLSGTAAVPPHRPGASLGRALHAAGYSDNRLMRLTGARGPALVDQMVRAARVLAAAGAVPVDLWTLRHLSADTGPRADAARLRLARDYYAAAHAAKKDAP